MSEYLLELKGVTKIFPGVKALDKVHFKLKAGQIHALMGENGAGKSTFIKTITGVHAADEGDMYYQGERVNFKNSREAQEAGIVAIYQHATSYPHLTVTENIFMGHEMVAKYSKRILWNKMHKKAQELLDRLGADFSAKTIIGTLSVAQQQLVEISKALSANAKVVIMDEPTAALTKKESEELYAITEALRDEGVGIIFISHRFEDMYRLASDVTVFRDSKYIGSWKVDEIKREDLIVAMVGREINQLFPESKRNGGEVVLSCKNLSRIGYFEDINFDVCRGEVLAFTGLIGSKRTEIFESLLGLSSLTGGEIWVNDKRVKITHPAEAMELGIGYVPEDRQLQGLILDWGIDCNTTLSNLDKVSTSGWINRMKEKKLAKSLAEKLGVKALSVFDKVSSLSGGNQQKVVISKLLGKDLQLMILDEPTKGVDVGAKFAIYEIINDLAAQGYAVIIISSEMPEVLGLSDRIVVMREGRIVQNFVNKNITQEMILEAAMSTVETANV